MCKKSILPQNCLFYANVVCVAFVAKTMFIKKFIFKPTFWLPRASVWDVSICFSFFVRRLLENSFYFWSHVPVRGAVPSNAKWPSSHLQKFLLIRGINCNFSNYVLASPADPHYIYGVHNLLVLIWMFMSQKSHFW